MLNCQSGTNSGVLHARKSLSAITNRSAISRRLVLCVFSQPYWSQFSELILVTDQENFGPFDNAGKKLVAFSKFTREFASAIDRRIHFSPQFSLYVRESVHDLRERDAGSDNKNVNVARRIFVSRGHGAKYEGQCDPLRQPSQTIGNQLRRAKRLARQTTQFPVKRALFIGLIVYLTAFDRPRSRLNLILGRIRETRKSRQIRTPRRHTGSEGQRHRVRTIIHGLQKSHHGLQSR